MLAIDSRTAHIWVLDFTRFTNPDLLAQYRLLLSPEESARMARFAYPHLQQRYLLARALVRCSLSHYAKIAPQDWQFAAEKNGKPYLINPPLPLSFNLSHSGERAVLAISLASPLGIDIEQLARKRDWIGIAQHYFHASEMEHLVNLPEAEQHLFFFRLWTLKESYLKARGTGISTGLDKAAFRITAAGVQVEFAAELKEQTSDWQFYHYSLQPDYLLSLACQQAQARPLNIHFFHAWPDCSDPLRAPIAEIIRASSLVALPRQYGA